MKAFSQTLAWAFVILLFVIKKIRLPSLVLLHFRLNGIQEDSVRAASSALSAIRISESISVVVVFFLISVSFIHSAVNHDYRLLDVLFSFHSFSWKMQDP